MRQKLGNMGATLRMQVRTSNRLLPVPIRPEPSIDETCDDEAVEDVLSTGDYTQLDILLIPRRDNLTS